jgi:uncharacterized protein YndB with AHSA1/START domain
MSRPLQRSIRVRCSLTHAFATFTGKLDLWWPPSHRRFSNSRLVLESKVGGRFIERSASGDEANLGEVLLWDPPHRLSYSWFPGAIEQPTRVDVFFVDQGDETLVEIVHSEAESGLGEAWPERVGLFDRAWTQVLSTLERFVMEAPVDAPSEDGDS